MLVGVFSNIVFCILLYAVFDFIWYKLGNKTPGVNAGWEYKTWWFWKYQIIRCVIVTIIYIFTIEVLWR